MNNVIWFNAWWAHTDIWENAILNMSSLSRPVETEAIKNMARQSKLAELMRIPDGELRADGVGQMA
jgi:hypothetical protein